MYMIAGRDFSGSLPADSFLKQQEHIYRYRVCPGRDCLENNDEETAMRYDNIPAVGIYADSGYGGTGN